MKLGKYFSLVILIAVAVSTLVNPAWAADMPVNLVINGSLVPTDPAPIMVDGRVMVPIRPVAEAIQAKIYWYEEEGRIEVHRGVRTVELWVPTDDYFWRSNSAYINGNYTVLDSPPIVVNGRTFIPLRLLSEGLGATVSWDESNGRVNIEIPEFNNLEGLPATVRDAAYNTSVADSYRFKVDTQLKIPQYPQFNIINGSGARDKYGNFYVDGHFAGWPFEALTLDKEYYLKSLLFNNTWVTLTELGLDKEDLERLEKERQEAEAHYRDFAYDYITDLIRIMGNPKVVSEEQMGGKTCQKVEFIPNLDSIQAFAEMKSLDETFNGMSLTLWIGKSDKMVYKADFQVNFTQTNYKTEKEEPGFVHAVIELSDINGDFKVSTPAGLPKK